MTLSSPRIPTEEIPWNYLEHIVHILYYGQQVAQNVNTVIMLSGLFLFKAAFEISVVVQYAEAFYFSFLSAIFCS